MDTMRHLRERYDTQTSSTDLETDHRKMLHMRLSALVRQEIIDRMQGELDQTREEAASIGELDQTLGKYGVLSKPAFAARLIKAQYALDISSRRHDDPTALIVIYSDADHFKSINDGYGHAVGDEALVEFAIAHKDALRQESEYDFVGRDGGDEFCIAILVREQDEQMTPDEIAQSIIDRVDANLALFNQLRKEEDGPDYELACTFGVGISRPGGDVDKSKREADMSIYEQRRALRYERG